MNCWGNSSGLLPALEWKQAKMRKLYYTKMFPLFSDVLFCCKKKSFHHSIPTTFPKVDSSKLIMVGGAVMCAFNFQSTADSTTQPISFLCDLITQTFVGIHNTILNIYLDALACVIQELKIENWEKMANIWRK